MESERKKTVAVIRTDKPQYPRRSPYHPSEDYPEYPFAKQISFEENYVYRGVRQLFYQLGLNRESWNTKAWNPLGKLIEPGMTVVLKPNFVVSRHTEGKNIYAVITNPAVLRAVADYCWIALKGSGKIIIADAPQYNCNFHELLEATRIGDVVDFYGGVPGPCVSILDLRDYWSKGKHFPSLLESLPGDPEGSLTINLGNKSAMYGKSHPEKLFGASYDRGETVNHHIGERHEYEVSRTIMNADVVISVPKLKVHKKVGVTLNAKGLVGIATNKNFLVHYSVTPPQKGGDQYPDGLFSPIEEMLISIERFMYDHLLAPKHRTLEYLHRSIYWIHNASTRRLGIKVAERKRMVDAGNWYGNDSAWRMTADLLKLFYFSDKYGNLHNKPQRRMFSVVDGIVGGENNGPLTPDPKPAGVLLAGESLVAVDLVASRLMGFDPLKMRLYQYILADPKFDFGVHSLSEIQVISPDPSWANCQNDTGNSLLNFAPHPGWVGHLEV